MKGIILFILLTLCSTLFVGGSWSFFTDNEASTGDQIASGTLDLKTDDADGVSQTLYDTAITPGDGVGAGTIVLKNTGTTAGTSLDISVSYVESDGVPNTTDMTADQVAGAIEVSTLTYAGADLLSGVADANFNGFKDIYDLAAADLSGQGGIAASGSKNFSIAVTTDNNTSAVFANDGIDVTLTFSLVQ